MDSPQMLYLSHSAPPSSGDPAWFIVEPRDTPEQQIHSLLDARRRVLAVDLVGLSVEEIVKEGGR